jgi:5-methylcytosine-specific restriction endonuclease McrA
MIGVILEQHLIQMDSKNKIKRGTIRNDGMIFWQYHKNGKEYWVTKEKYQDKKQKHLDSVKLAYKRNPQKIYQRIRKWVLANKEKSLIPKRAWQKRNPDKNCERRSRRRCRELNATLMLHKDQKAIVATIFETSSRVSKCTGIAHEVDHIVPLSKGGFHIHTNLQVIPAKINRRKGSKINA